MFFEVEYFVEYVTLLKYGLEGRTGTDTSSVGIEEVEEDVPRASRSIAEAFVPSGGIFMVDEEKDCRNNNLILFLLKARLSAG